MELSEDPRVKLAKLEAEYNNTRHQTKILMERYYRQAYDAKYVDENDIIDLLNQCKQIRQDYKNLKEELGLCITGRY